MSIIDGAALFIGYVMLGSVAILGAFFLVVGAATQIFRTAQLFDQLFRPERGSSDGRLRLVSSQGRVDRRGEDYAGELTPSRLAPAPRLSTPTPFDGGAA